MNDVNPLEAVVKLANQENIYIDEHIHDGHQVIRVSTHFYNTRKEIDRLIMALKSL